jgi:Uma2 family endonuclease
MKFGFAASVDARRRELRIPASMSALRKYDSITEEAYLDSPTYGEWQYEYVDGQVYAMAEPTDEHEIICLNIASAISRHLRHRKCKVFNGRKRVRIDFLNRAMHYYPDVMVVCEKEPPRDERFKENPVALVEVLSPTTEGTDIREKMFAYLNTASVNHYVIVSQEKLHITIYRRTQPSEGWEIEELTKMTDVLRLPDLEFEMPVSEIYEKIVFKPVPKD